MFLRIVSFILALSIFNAQASSGSNQSLKTAFDELNFALTVDWDQKDKSFYQAQVKEFNEKIASLQANGLTNSELLDFATSQVKDEALAKDITTAFSMISINKLSKEEARKLMLKTVSKTYDKGASWSGRGVASGALVVLLLALVGVAALAGGNVVVSGGGCYDEYVCYPVYDSWGYWIYDSCGYQTYCY